MASRLIGFDGRLWLANSVKGANHNSADIYSYDPLNGGLRYERRPDGIAIVDAQCESASRKVSESTSRRTPSRRRGS